MIQTSSDNLIFKALKFIKHGLLKVTSYDGKTYYFGGRDKNLNVGLIINKPGLTFSIIKKGSTCIKRYKKCCLIFPGNLL